MCTYSYSRKRINNGELPQKEARKDGDVFVAGRRKRVLEAAERRAQVETAEARKIAHRRKSILDQITGPDMHSWFRALTR